MKKHKSIFDNRTDKEIRRDNRKQALEHTGIFLLIILMSVFNWYAIHPIAGIAFFITFTIMLNSK